MNAKNRPNNLPRRESINMATKQETMRPIHEKMKRAERVLAKVRQRQLDLARKGLVEESARYARLACRVRRHDAPKQSSFNCCAA